MTGGLCALPKGIGRLAYLPWTGLKKLIVAQQAADRAARGGPVRVDGTGGAPPAGLHADDTAGGDRGAGRVVRPYTYTTAVMFSVLHAVQLYTKSTAVRDVSTS